MPPAGFLNRAPAMHRIFATGISSLRRWLAATCIFAAVAGSGHLAAQSTQQTAPRTLVFINANLVDGVSPQPLRGATLVVSDGRIQRIVTGPLPTPVGAQVIDLGGRYLVPGLIDAHTHVASLASARRALESGVTTIRSASVAAFQDVALRELVRSGALAGPDVVAAGVFVTPELGESVLADPRLARLHGGVRTAEELRHLVRVNLDRGVDVIKTRGTERAGLPQTDPRKQVYTEADLRVIVETAAERKIPVMAHAHGDEGAMAAVRAGVRSIEHGTYLSDATLALMRDRGVFLVPTYATVVDLVEPGGDYNDPALRLRGDHMLPRLRETVQRAHRLGVRIATGADTGYGPESVTRVAAEVAHLTEMGLSPLLALQAATTNAAELLGLGGRTGAIRVGLEADLLVVERNPLEEIGALRDVLLVVSNGQVALNRLPFGR